MTTATLSELAANALPDWFTVQQLAGRWQTSRSFVYQEMDRGAIESRKFGSGRGCRRISREAVLRYEAGEAGDAE